MRARAAAIVFAWLLVARDASADEADRLAAEALFAEGRARLAEGNATAACEKFAASQRLDPSVGAMINLAECASRRGETASAWLFYRDAAALAAQKGDVERERTALERAAQLSVPRLVVRYIGRHRAPRSLTVHRDGALIDPSLLGIASPVNPGTHVVEASAAGYVSWRKRFDVPAGGSTVIVDVPELTYADALEGSSIVPPDPGRRNAALIVGGVGIVAAAAGVVFGLNAASSWSDVTDACPNRHCPDRQTANDVDAKRSDAVRDSAIATGAFTISVLAFAGCALLWWSARSPSPSAGSVFPGARF